MSGSTSGTSDTMKHINAVPNARADRGEIIDLAITRD